MIHLNKCLKACMIRAEKEMTQNKENTISHRDAIKGIGEI